MKVRLLNDGGYTHGFRKTKFPQIVDIDADNVSYEGRRIIKIDVGYNELKRIGYDMGNINHGGTRCFVLREFELIEENETGLVKAILLNDGGFAGFNNRLRFPVSVLATLKPGAIEVGRDELKRIGYDIDNYMLTTSCRTFVLGTEAKLV